MARGVGCATPQRGAVLSTENKTMRCSLTHGKSTREATQQLNSSLPQPAQSIKLMDKYKVFGAT